MIRTDFMFFALIVSCHVSTASAFENSDANPLLDILSAEDDRMVDRSAELTAIRTRGRDRVWWQSGFVKGTDQWLTYDEAVALSVSDEKRQRYETERAAAGESGEEQLRLASWCGRNGLPERERAHLLVALKIDPRLQNERLMRRAGFEPVLGHWMSNEQLDRLGIESDRIDSSLKSWQTKLSRIGRQLRGTKNVQRKALNELAEISDPKAVAAIDLVLGRSPHLETARAAIRTLGQIDSYESSQVLAKRAISSDSPTIRREATECLANRRFEDFVPPMIALMATETTATVSPFRRISRVLTSELVAVFRLERNTSSQTQIASSRFRLVPRVVSSSSAGPNGRRLYPLSLRLQGPMYDIDAQVHRTKRTVDEVNEKTVELNGRIGSVLGSVTGLDSSAKPEIWWQWWNKVLDVDAPPRTVVEVDEGDTRFELPVHRRHSCFAAGTQVWTETGLRAIESIKVGDRVLSKSVESGELAFRPVLRTTIREAKPLVVIQSAEDELKVTGGHRFWQSGYGWVIARDLTAISRLHTVTGNNFVRDVRPGPSEQTYNLVVEGSHTYFVGKAGMLVQDLLLTPPTNMVVPGFTRFEMQSLATAE